MGFLLFLLTLICLGFSYSSLSLILSSFSLLYFCFHSPAESLTRVGFLGADTQPRVGAGTLSGGEVTELCGVGALVAARRTLSMCSCHSTPTGDHQGPYAFSYSLPKKPTCVSLPSSLATHDGASRSKKRRAFRPSMAVRSSCEIPSRLSTTAPGGASRRGKG
jgi:hypothetical protein